MEPDANSNFDPTTDSALKAKIDQTWLKLNTTKTGGGKAKGRWRNDG